MEQEQISTYIKKGDLVIINDKHKIFCGDSTDIESYKYLDGIATMTLTSPPYNVGQNNYGNGGVGGGQKYLCKEDDIMSDSDYLNLINKSLNNALLKSKYVFWNISHTSGNKISLIDFLHDNKSKYVDTMIWYKTTTLPAIEPNVLNSDFEYVYVFTDIKDNGRHIRIGDDFRGTISNVLRIARNTCNEYAKIHSALMTIELADRLIKTFTKENEIVLDVFSGLGTTLMSCIKHNRIYYGIELQPFYVEKTIERYIKFNVGKFNVKIIRDGKTIESDEVRKMCKEETTSLFDFVEGE